MQKSAPISLIFDECIQQCAISASTLIPRPADSTASDGQISGDRSVHVPVGIWSDLWQAGRMTDRQLIAARWSCIPYRRTDGSVVHAIVSAATYYSV